jgi:predicted dinucleotide-binding enzyme
MPQMDDVLEQAGSLAGKTLITCSMPMSADDSHMVLGLTTSGAETLAAKVPDAHVVSAFSTSPGEVLFPVFNSRGQATPPDMISCGDNAKAKRTAATLIQDVRFNPLDMGDLKIDRLVSRTCC